MRWALLGAVVLAVLRRRYVLVDVTGVSMLPTLRPGDRVLVRRTRLGSVRRGQLVVVAPPRHSPGDPPWLVKRAVALPGDPFLDAPVPPGRLAVVGDNRDHSVDSRRTGTLPASALLGVVVRRRAAGPTIPA